MKNSIFLILILIFKIIYCEDIKIRIVTLNLWFGGIHASSQEKGLFKFAEHLAHLDPDIIGLQEVLLGFEGNIIAKYLNQLQNTSKSKQQWRAIERKCFYTDTAILSKLKFTEYLDDACNLPGNGVSIELNGWRLNLLSLHLNSFDYGPETIRDKPEISNEDVYKGEEERIGEVEQIYSENKFKDWLNRSQSTSEPVLIIGDFNTASHDDWVEQTKDKHYGRVIEWPVTKLLTEASFIDTFRALNEDPVEEPGISWPFNPSRADSNEPADRIDYIFYQGSQLLPLTAFSYPQNKSLEIEEWPSDHAAIVADYIWEQEVVDYDNKKGEN